jgi:hypothetical protein
MLKARLHPVWLGGRDGYRYSVIYDGKLLVERSRDLECDAARALVAVGVTSGHLSLLDGKTGVPRSVVNIEGAAKLSVSEESRDGLRFRMVRNPDISGSSHESGEAGISLPEEAA